MLNVYVVVEGVFWWCFQMLVYYLKVLGGCGIMLVNIGVGLFNVKNIIDYLVVLCL